MTLGGIFSTTFAIFRRRLGLFIGLTAMPVAVTLVVAIILGVVIFAVVGTLFASFNGDGIVPALLLLGLIYVVGIIIMGLSYVYAQGMMVIAACETMEHRYPSFAEVRQLSKGFLGRYVGVYLLLTLAVLVLTILCYIPMILGAVSAFSQLTSRHSSPQAGITSFAGGFLLSLLLSLTVAVAIAVIGVRLAYLIQITATEKLRGMAILKRSWDLTRGEFCRTLGFLLLPALALSVVHFVLNITANVISSAAGSVSTDLKTQTIAMLTVGAIFAGLSLIVSLVETPLMLIYVTVMYVDQVRRSALPAHGYGPAGYQPPGYAQAPAYGPAGYQPPGYAQAPQAPAGGAPGYGAQAPGYGQAPQAPGYGAQAPGYGTAAPGYGTSPGSAPGYGGSYGPPGSGSPQGPYGTPGSYGPPGPQGPYQR